MSDRLYMIQKSHKRGFMDGEGRVLIRPTYDMVADEFHDGVAWVGMLDPKTGLAAVMYDDERWGYIDRIGNVVIKPMACSHAEVFTGGLARIQSKREEYGYIDVKGEFVWKMQK